MSFLRDGIYDRDHFRRRQNRRIRDADLGALEAAGRVAEIDAEIARRRQADHLASCAAEVQRRGADLLDEIASTSVGPKARWHRRLQQIQLTGPEAADELETLKAEVDAYTRLMRTFSAISATGTRRPAMDADPLRFPTQAWTDRRADANEAATAGAVSPAFPAGVWAEHRRADENNAAAIASSLAGLIDAVRRHSRPFAAS
jgi:hypothetical protein